ncbi:flagellar associated protein [Acrasis kona]|uniref:Flagellar associated protein n=1 Tax=Acrasis kona TaxID=1008807 RepID=A0AAW2YUD5_9EUKA
MLSYQRGNKNQDKYTTLDAQKQKEAELANIQKKLKENTKKLARNLKETPNETNNWKKVQTERADIKLVLENLSKELLDGLGLDTKQAKQHNKIHKSLKLDTYGNRSGVSSPNSQSPSGRSEVSYEHFLKKVLEEQEQKKYLKDIIEQEKETNLQVKQLSADVKREKELKKHEIEERSHKLTELVDELRNLKKLTQEDLMKTKLTTEASNECRRRQETSSLHVLEQELIRKKMELQVENDVFQQTKLFLDNKNAEMKILATNWRSKNDKESEEVNNRLSEWESKREDQIKQKEALERQYEKELEEKHIREDMERKRKEKEKIDLENKIVQSATCIKLCYKSFKARQMFEQLKATKSKKKTKAKSPKKR